MQALKAKRPPLSGCCPLCNAPVRKAPYRKPHMSDLSAEFKALANYRPTHKVRFVTAASLFDGHDAAINIMRRILQGMGTEVIHLGHNRSVDDVVTAALQEDVQGIAISSYQGGHVEYFKYMVDLLRERGGSHIQVFGGGGGVIVPAEIRELQAYGVSRIYSPEDGQRMGLAGMIGEMVMRCDKDITGYAPTSLDAIQGHTEASWRALAQLITALENQGEAATRDNSEQKHPLSLDLIALAATIKTPVLGITGTGGAGKSSLTDELIRRLRLDQNDAAARGGHQHRPQPPQERGCAAGRPHSHERHRPVAKRQPGVHAFTRHPRFRQRNFCCTARGDCRLQGGWVRSGDRGNLRHRPGRCGHRAARRCAHVCDDT
jgi:methylmalonyl-CoA mutase cobalamin-binding domain/chain